MNNNLLLEFSVSNFLSFKDKVTFSMEASSDRSLSDNVNKNKVGRVLKTTAIYGANASGKTNFIRAFTALILMVRNSDMIQIGAPIIYIHPFAFGDAVGNPSFFEVVFIRNGTKYIYGISATSCSVVNEYLKVYRSQKPSLIFSRDGDKYTFPASRDKGLLEMIAKMTPSNKLFLSTATTWNYSGTKEARLWFDSINTYDNFTLIKDSDLDEMSSDGNTLKPFMLLLLKEADIDINDFEISIEEMKLDGLLGGGIVPIPNNGTQERQKIRNVKVSMIHKVLNDGIYSKYPLDFESESSGTKSIFMIAPILKDAFENSKIIVVDELEKSLHPLLLKFILSLFHNKDINKASSQLIFSTHSTDLLDLNLFRRDQIWFTEKNKNSGCSSLYSLDDFSVRKGENIRINYLNNRYGGVPFISSMES